MNYWNVSLVLVAVSACALGQPVINEFGYDDTGADNFEFVEIYNPGPTIIAVNSLTLENRDSAGLSPLGLITFPMTPIPVGGYYVLGNAGVFNVNQVFVSGGLEDDMEVIVLRSAANATVIDAVTYESGLNTAGFPTNLIEGGGIWGAVTSNDTMMHSLSRTRDGHDTDTNGADFCLLPWTPGVANAPSVTVPAFNQNFDALTNETPVAGFVGAASAAFVINPLIAGPLGPTGHNPSSIPASPQGGQCVVVVDPAGGGNLVTRIGPAVRDLEFEAWVYFAQVNTVSSAEFESWSIGVRGMSDSAHLPPAPNPSTGTGPSQNGNTGVAWEYIATTTGATLYLRDENDGGADELTLATINLTTVNFGWQRLRLSVLGNQVDANFGGTLGDPTTGQRIRSSCSFANTGTLYLGYREQLTNNQNIRPLTLDAVRIETPAPQYQTSRTEVSAAFNQTLATPYHPARAIVCPGAPLVASFSSSISPVPFELAVALTPLVPGSSGGLTTPDGQIININLAHPSLFFLNGGSVPSFVPILYPFQFALVVPNFPGFEIALQAVILNPSSAIGLTFSQASSARISSSLADVCPAPAIFAAGLLSLVNGFAVQFYDASGAPQPLTWITTPSLVSNFVTSISTAGPLGDPIDDDLEHTAYIQTFSGTIHRLGLSRITSGQPGTVSFLEGSYSCTSNLHTTIQLVYGLTGYTSAAEKAKERKDPAAERIPWTEPELIPRPTKSGTFTAITLIVYNDNEGEDFLQEYAEQKALTTNGVAFRANGLNSIENEVRRLYGQCRLIDRLIFACHGSPGSFRIGAESSPFDGPNRVGRRAHQIDPVAFGRALRPYLGANAEIHILGSDTARTANTTTENGGQTLQDLAFASGANIIASDQLVRWPKRAAPNPSCIREPKTFGATWVATPLSANPVISIPAPLPTAPPTCLDP